MTTIVISATNSVYFLENPSGACSDNIFFSDRFTSKKDINNKIKFKLFNNITLNDDSKGISITRGGNELIVGLGSSSFSFNGGCAEAILSNGKTYHPWWEIPCTCQTLFSNTKDTISFVCSLSISGNTLTSNESDRGSNMYTSNTMTYMCTGQYRLESRGEL